jgi:hypothetical protein
LILLFVIFRVALICDIGRELSACTYLSCLIGQVVLPSCVGVSVWQLKPIYVWLGRAFVFLTEYEVMLLIWTLMLFLVSFVLVFIAKGLYVFLTADVRRDFDCLYG